MKKLEPIVKPLLKSLVEPLVGSRVESLVEPLVGSRVESLVEPLVKSLVGSLVEERRFSAAFWRLQKWGFSPWVWAGNVMEQRVWTALLADASARRARSPKPRIVLIRSSF